MNVLPSCRSGMQTERMGLGVEIPGEVSGQDDEYDSYRKRMMLAYRFRPNPLVSYCFAVATCPPISRMFDKWTFLVVFFLVT